ncbi:MAG: glycerophosphodiester phosphodiesterase family protein [Pseudomonadota bacterium]
MPDLDPVFLQTPLAHRGLHDREAGIVENSVSAVAAAIEAGYGIEIDVQLTSDGEAAVFHDATLDRLTAAAGPVRAETMSALSALPLTGSRDTIPSLAEILELVGGRAPLLIELKNQRPEDAGLLETRVAEYLVTYRGPVAAMSFDPSMVGRLATADIPRGLTTCRFDDDTHFGHLSREIRQRLAAITDFDAVDASFISHDWRTLDDAPVQALKQRGTPILCWTIRSAEEERIARRTADTITFEGYMPQPG